MENKKNKKLLEKSTQGPSFARKIPKNTHDNGRELYYNKIHDYFHYSYYYIISPNQESKFIQH